MSTPALTAQEPAAVVLRSATGPDGRVETQVITTAGTWVRVHDFDAPEAEARDLLDRSLKGGTVPAVVGVIGVGLGYVIDEIERRRPDVRIVALELGPAFADGWATRREWNDAITSGHLVLGTDPAYELSVRSWPSAALQDEPLVVVHPVLGQSRPAALVRAVRAFKQFIYEQRANAEARQRLAGLYLRHTIENLPALAAATDVSALVGLAAGQTVVLCGAGPSLDCQLPALRAHRQRAWLVALDTSLRPLMQAGIVPDIVVAVDPTPLNGRHLIDLPSRARPWLVAEASLDPRAIAAFAGRLFALRIGRADPWPWLETLGVSAGHLRVWGSVLTAGCDLVARMRASRLVFVGMDLAYTGGQPYCRGTAFEEDWIAQRDRDGLGSVEAVWKVRIDEHHVTEPDIMGRPARTSPQMTAFRNWVRALAASSPACQFINATSAGILHGPRIVQADLARTLRRLPACPAPRQGLEAAARRSFQGAVPRLREALDTAADDATPSAVYQAWGAAVPDFDAALTRRLLRQASRQLRTTHGDHVPMTNPETDWIDVPYDPTLFVGKPPLKWTVSEPNVATYAYRLQGKTMTLAFKINGSLLDLDHTANGKPSNELHLRIPGNYLPARGMANAVWMGSPAVRQCGYATVHPGLGVVVVLRESEEPFPTGTGLCLFGQLVFEVQ